jgi:uncharacterized membrane protein
MFEWIKVGHLLAATVWFGGTVYVEALLANAKRTKDPQILGIVGMRVGKTNMRLFPAAGILTLLFGSWLVMENSVDPFEWSSLFVSVGLLVAIIGLATGIFFYMPQMKKIEAILASEGPGSPELAAIAKKNTMVTHLMAGILTIAMIFMVVQP